MYPSAQSPNGQISRGVDEVEQAWLQPEGVFRIGRGAGSDQGGEFRDGGVQFRIGPRSVSDRAEIRFRSRAGPVRAPMPHLPMLRAVGRCKELC